MQIYLITITILYFLTEIIISINTRNNKTTQQAPPN